MIYLDLQKMFPNFTFWAIRGVWNDRSRKMFKDPGWGRNWSKTIRIYCTLEGSISLRKVLPFLESGGSQGNFRSIECWDRFVHGGLYEHLRDQGIFFAETGKVYTVDDLDELKGDYLVALLSSLKQ